ncbi:MAG: hypothetical protein HC910_22830 [Spirulinaceae cyanobacterium SM2_1_0]|nr:hypothetical protein [Spirulinaceae cyanobacterium SM2_1_0]
MTHLKDPPHPICQRAIDWLDARRGKQSIASFLRERGLLASDYHNLRRFVPAADRLLNTLLAAGATPQEAAAVWTGEAVDEKCGTFLLSPIRAPIYQSLARTLRCIRTYHNLSVAELAQRLAKQPDFAPSAASAEALIRALENAEHAPSLNTIGVYSQEFGIPAYQILFLAEHEESSAATAIRGFVTEDLLKLLERVAQNTDAATG